MERTYFPARGYWFAFEAFFSLGAFWLGLMILLLLEEDNHFRSPQALPRARLVAFWWVIAVSFVYVAAAIVYAVLAYRRKRLVISQDAVRSHGALLARVVRFADVIEARWLWLLNREHPYGLRVHTATKKLTIQFGHFVPVGAQSELVDLFRQRLDGRVRQNWDGFQAVREGRASLWGPTVFTIKSTSRMLAVAAGLAGIIGAVIGAFLQQAPGLAELWAAAAHREQISAFLQLSIPSAAEHFWSGSLPVDWGLGGAFMGLYAGIVFLTFLWFFEWADRKWRTIQGRRLERARNATAPGPFQPAPESRGG